MSSTLEHRLTASVSTKTRIGCALITQRWCMDLADYEVWTFWLESSSLERAILQSVIIKQVFRGRDLARL